ncbi:MAG: phosphate regulon transcriptional regulator PhoB [Alphaproteobacteria bacterium]|jgi:two-component system, OmpR family, phosphate regulon response regulator PhoB|nr:phosphate regulon transcriptional regulator PhoB [Alphaproteobacteria bacterium]MBT7944423.1 phosphate regulon transcriptional regulator PhoB [Alphaproteobacteria bacterium]
MSALILIVEDESPQAEMLRYNLEKEGFRTVVADTGEAAIMRVDVEVPDLVVLDWMLPERSGIDVCRELRARPETQALPIIMLTARGEEGDQVLGLEAGADDYVVKPYSPREMVARVQALLRRARAETSGAVNAYAGVVLDRETHKVTRDGAPIDLGPTSFKLLEVLMERPGRVYSRDRLLGRVWGGDVFVEPRTVDVHIRRLRKALNGSGGTDIVRTVRGAGYALDAGEA